MAEIPPDAPEADVQEQARDWTEPGDDDKITDVPIDAPEADVLDQHRPADLDDEDREPPA